MTKCFRRESLLRQRFLCDLKVRSAIVSSAWSSSGFLFGLSSVLVAANTNSQRHRGRVSPLEVFCVGLCEVVVSLRFAIKFAIASPGGKFFLRLSSSNCVQKKKNSRGVGAASSSVVLCVSFFCGSDFFAICKCVARFFVRRANRSRDCLLAYMAEKQLAVAVCFPLRVFLRVAGLILRYANTFRERFVRNLIPFQRCLPVLFFVQKFAGKF